MAVSKRRLGCPQTVQHLWDAIVSIRLQKQVPIMDRISNYMRRKHNLNPSDLERQINFAVKDNLITTKKKFGCKGSKVGVEQEGYCLPEEPVEKDSHDWYCFECHRGGEVLSCTSCHRVYHSFCVKEDPATSDIFTCAICKIISSKNAYKMKKDELNTLLGFTCVRLREKTRDLHRMPHPEEENWRHDYLIFDKMDLNILEEKTKANEYRRLEEFQADAQTIVHNVVIYYGVHSALADVARLMLRDCIYDLGEIRQCRDCYSMSNEKTDKFWFCQPCDPPHELVYAKQKGYPYWPAKVIRKANGIYDVRFFGGHHERANIEHDQIRPITLSLQQLSLKRTFALNRALDELRKHQNLLQAAKLAKKESTAMQEEEEEEDDEKEEPKEDKIKPKDEKIKPKEEKIKPKDEKARPKEEKLKPKEEKTKSKEDKKEKPKEEKTKLKEEKLKPRDEKGKGKDDKSKSREEKGKPKLTSNSLNKSEPPAKRQALGVSTAQSRTPSTDNLASSSFKGSQPKRVAPQPASVPVKAKSLVNEQKRSESEDETVSYEGQNNLGGSSPNEAPSSSTNKKAKLKIIPTPEDHNVVTSSSQETPCIKVTVGTQTHKKLLAGLFSKPLTKVESPPQVSCNCDTKYSKMFRDQKERLEAEYAEKQEKACTELEARLKREFEEEKAKEMNMALEKMHQEMEQSRLKNEEQLRLAHEQEGRELQERLKSELSETKKKQWCYNCELEAIYHCCWNTSYCSVECQQVHWHKEHKRTCRRKR